MHSNRRQSLADLCNPKLARLTQVPHRIADREEAQMAATTQHGRTPNGKTLFVMQCCSLYVVNFLLTII